MLFVENVIPHLFQYLEEAREIVLVTLVNVDGSTPRPVGSQIGVASDGRSVGMLTGGCAEKAITAEALRCLQRRENKLIRYGAGSPYLDVVLPCGSGVDLYFETTNAEEIVRTVHAAQSARRLVQMSINLDELTSRATTEIGEAPAGTFTKTFTPDYRIHVFGEGSNLATFCNLAHAAGFTIDAYSPDADALDFINANGARGHRIHRSSNFADIEIDAYAAVVTLFHEHEWEAPILHAALNSNADYIGALGSRKTHDLRLAALRELEPTRNPADVIHGPIGLDIGATNPSEISLAILAEITQSRRRERSPV